MGFKDFFFKKQEPTSVQITPMQSFNTPFGKIGEGNLSLPYVRAYSYQEPYIRFGHDNLYPQVINQMYYTSPLNGGIINFKTNSVIGAGFELISNNKTAKNKVDEYTFLKFNNFEKLSRLLTKDLIMHGRLYVKMCKLSNGRISYKRVGPEKVRVNADKTLFSISDDWSRSINIYTLPHYTPEFEGECLYAYEIDMPGQDIYPIPSYCSCLNWAFVDGEMAYLQKSNIINSIFPSFMMTMAKKMSAEEMQQFKRTIDGAKGAKETGKVMAFIGQFPEELPTVTALPTNNNDKVFTETVTNLEANICRAHEIDSLIMGIRVSGKLGSGAELPIAYAIYEKNVVLPLRMQMEEVLNDLLFIGNVQSTLKIKDYQIIDGEITKVNRF